MVHPPDAPSTALVSTAETVKERKIIDILVLKPHRSLHAVSLSLRFLMMDRWGGAAAHTGKEFDTWQAHFTGKTSLRRATCWAARRP